MEGGWDGKSKLLLFDIGKLKNKIPPVNDLLKAQSQHAQVMSGIIKSLVPFFGPVMIVNHGRSVLRACVCVCACARAQ